MLRLGAALYRFWIVRGHMRAGRRLLERALALPGAGARTAARARVTFALGTISHEIGEFANARAHLAETRSIAQQLGDERAAAAASNGIGWVASMVGDIDASVMHCSEALTLHRKTGDRRGEALALHNLAFVRLLIGEAAGSRELYEQAIAIMRQLGDRRAVAYFSVALSWVDRYQGRRADAANRLTEALITLAVLRDSQLVAWALAHRGLLALDAADPIEAVRTFDESVARWREVGNAWGLAWTLGHLAEALLERGDVERARDTLAEAVNMWPRSGARSGPGMAAAPLGHLYLTTHDHQTLNTFRHAIGLLVNVRYYSILLEALEFAAAIALDQGNAELAARTIGGIDAMLERTGGALTPRMLQRRSALEQSVRTSLGDAAFDAARAAGGSLPIDDVAMAVAER
jgi:tetratricopeptide (TPR) repeat protein